MIFKKPRLILLYGRDFFFYSMLITLLSYFLYHRIGNGALTSLFWFKVLTSAIGIFIHQDRKSNELFFYLNNGLGRWTLTAVTLAVDMGIWFIGITILVRATL